MTKPSTSPIHSLIQWIVSEATERGVSVTPIHILKYVYLADLFYARDNAGKTFTGIEWKFHHFGPYSYEILDAINVASQQGLIHSKGITSLKTENDFVVFFAKKQDSDGKNPVESAFSPRTWGTLRKSIKDYGNGTSSLLHFVYFNTEPMEQVAPGDVLKFDKAIWPNAEASSKLGAANAKILKEARGLIAKIKGPQKISNAASLNTDQQKVLLEGLSWLNEADDLSESSAGTASVAQLLKSGT